MREPENIARVAALHPDYLGLIFYEKSSRFVKNEVQQLPGNIKKTGVFVNASEEEILEKTLRYELAAIQLHGEESPDFCRDLRDQLSKAGKDPELIKVFSIKEEFDLKILEPYENVVDLFLFDTKGKNKGGNGVTFNWEVLENYPSSVPFFLSGGIGRDEIPEIIAFYLHFQKEKKQQLFYGIDVNSRFEIAPGLKDEDKLKTFRDQLISEVKKIQQ